MSPKHRHWDPTVKPLWNERRLLLLGASLGILLGAVILVGTWTAMGSLSNCHRIQHLDRVIQKAGLRNLATLGKPGGSAYAYYHQHPDELRAARQQLVAQVHDFQPPACSLPF